MKKILLGTTALVAAAGFAGFANAQEVKSGAPSLSISGELEFEAAYFDNDGLTNDRSFDFWQGGDLTFSPSWTHDNGITVTGRIDMVTAANEFVSDETSLTFKSASFGTVVLGDDDGPIDSMRVNGPLAGDGLWDGTAGSFVDNNGAGAGSGLSSLPLDGGNSSDNTKIFYSTSGLDLSGFVIGLAFTPTNNGGKQGTTTESARNDAMEAAVNWSGSFNGVSLKAGASYYTAKGSTLVAGAHDSLDPTGYNIGGQVGFGAFLFGAGYNSAEDFAADSNGFNANYDSWNVGATYTVGAWSFGGNYGDIEREGNGADGSAYGLGATYALAKGISLNGDLMFYENDTTNNDSTVIQFGTKVKF